MFRVEQGSTVVLICSGLFKQAELVRRSKSARVYAKWGNGFIRLGCSGATSKPGVSWECLDSEYVLLPSSSYDDPVWSKQCPA